MSNSGVRKAVCFVRNEKDLISLSEIRMALGLTQKSLAELLGVTVDTVQGWENGRKNPSGTSRKLLGMLATNPNATIDLIRKAA